MPAGHATHSSKEAAAGGGGVALKVPGGQAMLEGWLSVGPVPLAHKFPSTTSERTKRALKEAAEKGRRARNVGKGRVRDMRLSMFAQLEGAPSRRGHARDVG